MVDLVPTSTAGSPTETFCANDILPVTPASDQPVSKHSVVPASDAKRSRLSGSLNVKRRVRTPSPDWSSPRDISNFGREDKKGWAAVIQNSSNLLSNVDWTRTFWKSTNATNTMHTLGIKGDDNAKGLAAFWVIGTIEYARLELNATYPSWNIKVICNEDILDNLRQILLAQGILGEDWVKPADKFINVSTNKSHVKGLIALMDDNDEREWMSQLCDKKKFPFTYNGIKDENPNPGYDVEEFRQGREVAVEFTTHAINFRTVSKPDLTFNYNFRLQSLYLVESERTTISTPSRRKRGPDEWLVSPPRTSKTNFHLNPLNWSVGNSEQS